MWIERLAGTVMGMVVPEMSFTKICIVGSEKEELLLDDGEAIVVKGGWWWRWWFGGVEEWEGGWMR